MLHADEDNYNVADYDLLVVGNQDDGVVVDLFDKWKAGVVLVLLWEDMEKKNERASDLWFGFDSFENNSVMNLQKTLMVGNNEDQ